MTGTSNVFRPFLPADQIDGYIAGLILLAATTATVLGAILGLIAGAPTERR